MKYIEPVKIPKIIALGFNDLQDVESREEKKINIKYISASKDDKFVYLYFEVLTQNITFQEAKIYVEEIDTFINDVAVPRTKITILKTGTTRIKLRFAKDKNFTEQFYDDGNIFQATIISDGLSAKSRKFKIIYPIKTTLWEKIYAKYPTPYTKKPCTDDYYNQCAIRMSIALLGAGINLQGVENKTNPGGQIKCSHGHVLGAYNLKEYIIDNNLFGKAIQYNGMQDSEVLKKVKNTTGILFFEEFQEDNTDDGTDNPNRSTNYRHIEVWNGQRLLSGFDEQMFKAKVILFWKIK